MKIKWIFSKCGFLWHLKWLSNCQWKLNESLPNVVFFTRNTNQKQLTRRRKSFTKRENVEKSLTKHEILFLRFAMICNEQVGCQAKDYNPILKKSYVE